MKYLLITFLAFLFSCTYHNAQIEDLPEDAQDFINAHFADYEIDDIYFYNRHDNKIEVDFEDETRIIFSEKGKWLEVDGGVMPIPTAFIEKSILDYLKKHYPDAKITQVEKEKKGTDIDLDNGLELEFNDSGVIRNLD